MTACTTCGTIPTAKFCGDCGKAQGAGDADGGRSASRDRRPRGAHSPRIQVAALSTEAGRTAYQSIQDRKAKSSRRLTNGALVVMLVAGLSAFATPLTELGMFVAIGAFILALFFRTVRWSQTEYYSIPGSRNAQGEHACIHCAGKGIYRHGQYKSHVKYADCSRCKQNLWCE